MQGRFKFQDMEANDNRGELDVATNAAKMLIHILRTFEKISPFVTLQFNPDHILLSVINTTMTMFAVVRFDSCFFARYALFNIALSNNALSNNGGEDNNEDNYGLKLDTLLLANALRCDGVHNNTLLLLKDDCIELHRQVEGGTQLITLYFEVVDFIHAVTPPMHSYEGNLLVAMGSLWHKMISLHHHSPTGTQVQLDISSNNLTLLTMDKVSTQNSMPSSSFHTWKVQQPIKLVAPLSELLLISSLADKALLQMRFGQGLPLIVEMVTMGGCLARFIISVIEGELRDVNQRIVHHRKKRTYRNTPREDYEKTDELEAMLEDDDF